MKFLPAFGKWCCSSCESVDESKVAAVSAVPSTLLRWVVNAPATVSQSTALFD